MGVCTFPRYIILGGAITVVELWINSTGGGEDSEHLDRWEMGFPMEAPALSKLRATMLRGLLWLFCKARSPIDQAMLRNVPSPKFSHIWLAGGGSWRNIEGCRHMAVKTKLDETAGSSSSTIPAEPRNPHCHFQHWPCQVHSPGEACGAPQESLWLPRAGHKQAAHGASWGTEERKRGAGSFQKRQESKAVSDTPPTCVSALPVEPPQEERCAAYSYRKTDVITKLKWYVKTYGVLELLGYCGG
ncbi:hypothetical protein EK904_012325 [Melospiza melodia maxima]|nr:hypothetical protein EK904_012325 [Melospiza melodia maxima]